MPDFRAEFGAHLEASYPRLVVQLCLITGDVARAHELVSNAYARAWQGWSTVRELPDPGDWIRRLAVRADGTKWNRLRRRLRSGGSVTIEGPGPAAAWAALAELPTYVRRPLVLADVAHLPIEEVAEVEGVVHTLATSRVDRGRTELARAMDRQAGAEGAGDPGSVDVAAPLRALDEELTRSVEIPPVDAVIRRAVTLNRTNTAATAAVLTVGVLGAVTVIAQSVSSGSVPLPAPQALAPVGPFALADPASPPIVADVLNPGEQLVRMNPGVPAPAGSRGASDGTTVLPRGTRSADAEPVDASSKPSSKPESRQQDRQSSNAEGSRSQSSAPAHKPEDIARSTPQFARVLPQQRSQPSTPRITRSPSEVSRSLPRLRPDSGSSGLFGGSKKNSSRDPIRSLTGSGKSSGKGSGGGSSGLGKLGLG